MKQNPVLVGSVGGVLILFVATALLVHTSMVRRRLSSELKELEDKIASAYGAKNDVDTFERTRAEVTRRDEAFSRAIPINEKRPLAFVKELTRLADELGAQNFSVSMKTPKAASPPTQAGSAPAAAATSEATPPQSQAASTTQQPMAEKQIGDQSTSAEMFTLMPIQLEFELEFSHLLTFLKRLRSLERLTTLEGLKISRDQKLLPRQKISLTINLYTLTGS